MNFSDTDFFRRQRDPERRWLWPLVLAIGIHVVTLSLSAVLPNLIHRKAILDEVVTVNLVSLPEAVQQKPELASAPPKRSIQKKAVKPAANKRDSAKILETEKPEQTPSNFRSAKPVSLRPLKRKLKKTGDTSLVEDKIRQKRLQDRKKAVAEARRAEELARLEAVAARKAVADLIRETGLVAHQALRSSSGRKQVQSLVFKQYLSSLYDQVRKFWVLPEMRRWNPGLETIVVLTIRKDGSVIKTFIEKKSKDPFFDQFVMKTLQSAAPMPPFPSLMPQDAIEVGLRFRPGHLLNVL